MSTSIFLKAAQNAAKQNNPSTILNILAPVLLAFNRGAKAEDPLPRIPLDATFTSFESVFEIHQGNFEQLQPVDKILHLNYLVYYLTTINDAVKENHITLEGRTDRINNDLLKLSINVSGKALHHSAGALNIDLTALTGSTVNPLRAPENYFSPRETFEFVLAYNDFFKEHFAAHLTNRRNKRSMAGIKSHFSAAANQYGDITSLSQQAIIKGFEDFSTFYQRRLAQIQPSVNNHQSWAELRAATSSLIQLCDSYTGTKAITETPATTRPKVVPFDQSRRRNFK